MERERGNKGGREGGAIRREGHGKREEEGWGEEGGWRAKREKLLAKDWKDR